MRARYWIPPVAWMGVILVLSSDAGSAAQTSRVLVPVLRALWPAASPLQLEAVHGLIRKAAHVAEYAVLAALWFQALVAGAGRTGRSAAWTALAISAAWAGVDEFHQSFYPSRGAGITDVALDAAAAALAAGAAGAGWRVAVDRLTVALLWVGAVGGVCFVVVNLALGVAPGALWLTTPVAIVALTFRHRWRGADL